jgi:hypothetical protein
VQNRRCFLIALFAIALRPAFAQLEPPSEHPRQQEAVRVASEWLDLNDQGKNEQSFEMLAPTFKRNLTPTIWREAITDTNAKLGKRFSRSLRRVVWYENPRNAPLPGMYAAVEFDSVFEKADMHFQYVMLHSQDGAPFRIMRNEVTFALNKPTEGDPKTR